MPGGLEPITAAAAGGLHSLLLTASGDVLGFGSNANGQLGSVFALQRPVAYSAPHARPVVETPHILNEDDLGRVVAVAARADTSIFLNDRGDVFTLGRGDLAATGVDQEEG